MFVGRVVVALAVVASGSFAGPAVAAGGPTETITLVTGDTVVMRASGVPVATAGPGRGGMRFQVSRVGGDTFVVPYDALRLTGAGKVDRRLFNVTKLAALGYGDRARGDIPLIVEGTARAAAGVRREPKDRVGEFWKSLQHKAKATTGMTKVWLDGKVTATLDRSVPQIGAPTAWRAGQTGSGTKVAVLDSGIDTSHPDLTDAVVQAQDFTESGSGTDDRSGHGTHVASTIAGSGAASGGKYKGVAPGAKLLNGKVLDDDGDGSESAVLAGMEWAAAQGAEVVNLSLGSKFPTDGKSPLDLAVDRLTAETGTLFVAAAGNNGPGSQTVSSPAAADAALAVGAVDHEDRLAEFSSRGPRAGDAAIKPDLTAPGVGIVAARAKNAVIGTPVDASYLAMDGTSMAAPHVAGAAAILAGQHPEWTPAELKAALMGSAEPNPALTVYQQGAGRADVGRAATQQVRADAGSIDFGEARWPHDDDKPVRRTVNYRNDGDQPVTLTLSTSDLKGPQGAAVPAGMFVLSATTVTVPAHGSAAVDVVANPAVSGPDGTYQGGVVATAGTTRVRTAVALYREPESYDVTVRAIGHDGQPAPLSHFMIANVDRPGFVVRDGSAEQFVLRLPKGTYYWEGFQERMISEQPFAFGSEHFFEPNFAIATDTMLTLDARDTVPLVLRSDRPEADQAALGFDSWRDTPYGGKASVGGSTGGTEAFPMANETRVRPSQTSAPGAYFFSAQALLAKLDGHGGWSGSPYQYHLKWHQDGRVPRTLDRRFRDRDLAEQTTVIAAQAPGELVTKDLVTTVSTPGKIVERYSPGYEFEPGTLTRRSADGQLLMSQGKSTPRFFATKGVAPPARWNVGPFMPADDTDRGSRRTGDAIDVQLWMYSDQDLDHTGDSLVDSGRTRLLRDGVEIAAFDYPGELTADVPAGSATYRLEVESSRSITPFSTRQSAAWTFRSSTTAEPTPLPLLFIRFAPNLDHRNQAPSGTRYAVPVQLSAGKLTAVEASYDDGATWRPAKLQGDKALLDHPHGNGYVSLRATALDAAGNRSEQTVIHAYKLTG